MYAIAFDFDTAKLKAKFGESDYRNRYKDVEKFFAEHDFHWQQGSLYYGDKDKVKLGTAFLVARKLSQEFPWISECVGDIRVLAIMEEDDLKPHFLDA